MRRSGPPKPRRVLIASSHPLFGQGLRSLLKEWQGAPVEVVGNVTNLEEALDALEKLEPDLIIVDYDDETLNREEFLRHFVGGEKRLRVVLLSLQSTRDAMVYERQTMAASRIGDWLLEWAHAEEVTPIELKQKEKQVEFAKANRKHLIIASVFVFIVTFVVAFILKHIRMLPLQASLQARPVDHLFSLEFDVIAFLFSLIVVFMVYSVIFFRRKPGDTTDAPHITGNTRLEVVWTAAPLITVLVFAYLGGTALAETLKVDPQAMQINVTAQQWSWRFEYPQYNITSDTLYMPVNKQVNFALSSVDVIHSFWVPEFRIKQDVLPGGPNFIRYLRITPTVIGEYMVRCSEMCGLRHAYMLATVKVVSQQNFDAWVATQLSSTAKDPASRGKLLAQQYGCLSCHTIDGSSGVGPTWKGLSGSQVTLDNGTKVTADDAYLKESVVDPDAKIVNGFSNIMPTNFARQLSDSQISDIIAFIKSLK